MKPDFGDCDVSKEMTYRFRDWYLCVVKWMIPSQISPTIIDKCGMIGKRKRISLWGTQLKVIKKNLIWRQKVQDFTEFYDSNHKHLIIQILLMYRTKN